MEKSTKRAERRHHIARLKSLRRKWLASRWSYESMMTPRRLGKSVHTPAMCSCFMCGNPRKYFGEKTREELRFEHEEQEGLAALGEERF